MHKIIRPDIGTSIDFVFGEYEPPEITWLEPGGPAAESGLTEGDEILEINGMPIDTEAQLQEILDSMRIGGDLKITIDEDGKSRTVMVPVIFKQMSVTRWIKECGDYLLLLSFWVIGSVCLIRNRGQPENWILALFCFSVYCMFCSSRLAVDAIFRIFETFIGFKNVIEGNFFRQFAPELLHILSYVISVMLVASSFLHLFSIFPRRIDLKPEKKRSLWIGFFLILQNHPWSIYIIPVILSGILYFLMRFFGDLEGLIISFYFILVIFFVIGIIRFFLTYRQDDDPVKRRQERILLIGVSVSTLGIFLAPGALGLMVAFRGASDFLFIFLFKYKTYFSQALFIVLLLSLVFAVFRFKMVQIDQIANRAVLGIAMLVISIAIFTLTENMLVFTLAKFYAGPQNALSLASSVVVALVFTPIRTRVDGFIKSRM
ncbi:PDZ domain-containing protein [bacterium]|nr:PDZ domain-containing protein [candidate division CSSED10-310 bacterium]